MDPFILQLIIVPIIVIGAGNWFAILFKKPWIAPIVTFVLTIIINSIRELYYYQELEWGFIRDWCVIWPVFSFIIALIIYFSRKQKLQSNH